MSTSKEKKSSNGFLWIGAATALLLCIFYLLTDVSLDSLKGGTAPPVAGKVYELTADNLAVARRHSPVLVALYTTKGNVAGSRMARSLTHMAERVKDRAMVAMGNLDDSPELARKADVNIMPSWVVYRDGEEISRATGENSDLGVEKLLNMVSPPTSGPQS